MIDSDHETHMNQALELAQIAYNLGEVPVGAVIVYEGAIISEAYNQRESEPSALAHAEITAIAQACKKLDKWRLAHCTLFTTLEPCVMCSGAILQARIPKVVFGAMDSKGGGHSLFRLLNRDELNHRVEVVSGVLQEPCSHLLTKFFKERRVKR